MYVKVIYNEKNLLKILPKKKHSFIKINIHKFIKFISVNSVTIQLFYKTIDDIYN